MRRSVRIAVLGTSFLLLGVAANVWPVDWGKCRRTVASELRPEIVVPACSHIIDGGKASREDLATAYYLRGRGYHKQGDLDAAITDYDSAIRLKPDLAQAYNNRGFAFGGKGELDRTFSDYKKAAALGDADGQANLGLLYAGGVGVAQDFAEAAKWLQPAAENGHAVAQHSLGVMYYHGQGVAQDYLRAAIWFRLAAELGLANGQTDLGVMYCVGEGVTQNVVVAHMWFSLAAAQGHANAVKARNAVASVMTPDQIAEAQRLAREWMAAH